MEEKIRWSVVYLFNPDLSEVLFVRKNRGPFPGKLNGVGGKLDLTKDGYAGGIAHDFTFMNACARREIMEETGVIIDSSELNLLVKETFYDEHQYGAELWVYCGIVKKDSVLQLEDEKQIWYRVISVFNPQNHKDLAGNGNIPYHIKLALIKLMEKK